MITRQNLPIIDALIEVLEASMNTYYRMRSAYISPQHIYVGSFDFNYKRRITKYGYISYYNHDTLQNIVICRCIDKSFEKDGHYANLEFEFEPYDDDDVDIQILKYLG